MSDALKEAYAVCPTGSIPLDTLEIRHPSISPIYLVKNMEPIVAKLETGETVTFEAAAFELTKPRKSDEGVQDLELKVCNVDSRLSDFFGNSNNFSSKVSCFYRPYLSKNIGVGPEALPLVLTLSEVQANEVEISARASFADLINKKFPSESYTRSVFPNLGG